MKIGKLSLFKRLSKFIYDERVRIHELGDNCEEYPLPNPRSTGRHFATLENQGRRIQDGLISSYDVSGVRRFIVSSDLIIEEAVIMGLFKAKVSSDFKYVFRVEDVINHERGTTIKTRFQGNRMSPMPFIPKFLKYGYPVGEGFELEDRLVSTCKRK